MKIGKMEGLATVPALVTSPEQADGRRGRAITRLVGVYDADGGVVGETRYIIGHLLGRLDCALCDITHGPLRRRREFDVLRRRVGVPFALVHRNERAPEIRAVTDGALPCVVAAVDDELLVVLDPAALAACGPDVTRFEASLLAALRDRDLSLPV